MIRTKGVIAAAVAIAATVVLTGSAFTASNTMPTDGGRAGYGSVEATGVPITGVEYVASTADGSKLDKVLFTTGDADAGSMTGTLSIKNSAGTLVVQSQDCGSGVTDGLLTPTYTFTCDPTTDPAVTDVVTVGFTATMNGS